MTDNGPAFVSTEFEQFLKKNDQISLRTRPFTLGGGKVWARAYIRLVSGWNDGDLINQKRCSQCSPGFQCLQ